VTNAEANSIGRGGDITINAGSLSLTDGAALSASTRGQGNAGSVFVQANDLVSLENGRIFSTVESGAMGDGGLIDIDAGSLSLDDGGQILTSVFGSFVEVDPGGRGNAGNVNIDVRDAVTIAGRNNDPSPSAIFSNVEPRTVGNAGNITISAGSLSLTDGAQVSSSTFGRGDAGIVTVQADDAVSLAGGGTDVSSNVGVGAVGKGGDINIQQARSLSVTGGAELRTQTLGEGNAGNIRVNTSDFVELSGVAPFPVLEDGVTPGGFSSGLFTTTESGARGQGGELSVTTLGTLRVSDGATLSARSRSEFRGGNITVNANELEVTDGGQLLTTAFSNGDAGNITVNVTDRITISGSDPTFSDRFNQLAEFFVNGFDRFPNGVEVARFTIDPVGPFSEITVSSQGSGNAGNLEVRAGELRLNNQGKLTAQSRSGQGGNITLQDLDLLQLRNQSQISTTAGTEGGRGDGGDIRINTDLLVALENSDITANAFEGQGGNIRINTQGLFLSPDSEITASSERGIDGTVEINRDLDPSQGLVILPAELVDASNQIVTGCAEGGESVARNEFIITGRGGLPPDPNGTLSGEAVLTEWATLDSDAENLSSAAPATNSTKVSAPTQIVEASGWMINNKGEVVLTAQAPTATINIPWLPDSDCQTPESEP
jgi:large exoprotein involved in heme utilization and adhesion